MNIPGFYYQKTNKWFQQAGQGNSDISDNLIYSPEWNTVCVVGYHAKITAEGKINGGWKKTITPTPGFQQGFGDHMNYTAKRGHWVHNVNNMTWPPTESLFPYWKNVIL